MEIDIELCYKRYLTKNRLGIMRFQTKTISMGLLVLLLNFLMACRPGSDNSKPTEQVVDDDVSAYSEASCLYKYDEGDHAETHLTSEIKTTYFRKKYDVSLLNAVLRASASEVVHFAESKGVKFFKTQAYKNKSCNLLESLPSAPSDLEGEFQKGLKTSTILGLYLSLNTPELPSTDEQAAIIIRQDGNKWILVHEFMHHLFQIQAESEGIHVNDLKAQVVTLSDEFDKAENEIAGSFGDKRKQAVKKAANRLNQLSSTFFQLIKQYMLEEMTIETTLGEQLENYKITKVHNKQRINGAAYTIQSAKNANEFIEFLKTENVRFKDRYMNDLVNEDYDKLSQTIAEHSLIKGEISSLVDRAKKYLASIDLEYKGLQVANFSAYGENEHVGCSHSKIPDEIKQIVMRFKVKK